MRVLYELAQVVAGPYDVDDLLERICSEIRKTFDFERALLVRLDPENRTVHAPVLQGLDWPGNEWLLLDKFPILVEAVETGRAVFVPDARKQRAVPATLVERFDVHSIVAVPLIVEGETLGFIVGDRREGGGRFDLTEEELAFLTALGSVAAVFIAKADQYAELQKALEEIKGLDQAKSEFISIASHELRTPISVVHGITTTMHLRGHELEPQQLEELGKTLHEQTSRLRDLAEALLDLSQIDSGTVSLEPQRFNARDQLEALVVALAPERMGEVEIEVDPQLELECNLHAFERIVSNLIMNALRYGTSPVTIRSENAGPVRLVVEDRGKGLEPEFVPFVFDRFTRGQGSRIGHPDGAGLGLSIARSFARSLGGELTYEAAEPVGARFTLDLPR